MQQTANLKLDKFEYADYADIPPVQGGNMDKIDVAIYNLQQSENTQGTDINKLKTDTNDLKGKVNTKPSTQMVLEAEESKSASIEISSLINPKYEGVFRQNLIDTHKCIYRIDSSPLPINTTDNSMKVMSYSSAFVGTGCYVGVSAGKEYTIKSTSQDNSSIYIYDANGLTFDNRNTKRVAYSSNVTNHNFKFTAPSSNYIFIAFNKIGSDTSGTTFYNPICLEGDFVGKDIEWVKGTQPSIPRIDISTPSNNKSSFKLNDWLGDGEIYENGLVTKQWGRILLSESFSSLTSSNLANVYRFDIKMKKSYSGYASTATKYIDVYFKDFIKIVNSSLNAKHIYMVNTEIAYDQLIIFIPKAEIDSLSGNNLNEKFINRMKQNDDYVYYKKASSTVQPSNASSIGGTFNGENNTFTNQSFGKATFDYQNSVMDSLNALSSSANSLNTDQIVQDYTQKISDKIVALKDRTVKQTDWVFDNFNGRYYLEFENELISPNKVVDVNFNINSYSNARVVLGITSSDYGKVTLYARTQPSVDLVADIIIKEAN